MDKSNQKIIDLSSFEVNGIPCPMVYIEGGTFEMGSNEREREQPIHSVIVPSFYLGKFLVTQSLFENVMGKNPSHFQGITRPVEQVSWEDAELFISCLNEMTKHEFRLPTEAEWEYAARATTQSEFNTGDCISSTQANFDSTVWFEDCAVENVHLRETAAVKSYPSNQWELFDVHGNVWEWTEDCWNETYRDAPDDGSAWITGECDLRVLRGGGWDDRPVNLRSANRFWSDRVFDDINVGFRLARTP